MHIFRSLAAPLIGVLLSSLLLPSLVSAYERTVECASLHNQYEFCRVRTQGYARLVKQLSHSSCVEGRSWGVERDGIWVDRGCRGRFAVGRGAYRPEYDDDDDDEISGKDIATAAAVIGGVALLGSLLGDQQAAPPQYPDASQYGAPNPVAPPSDPYGAGITGVPAWATGTFRGYDSVYNTELELTIDPNGQIYGYADGRPIQGIFRDNRIEMRNVAFYVQYEDGGFRAIQVDNNANQIEYRRIQ